MCVEVTGGRDRGAHRCCFNLNTNFKSKKILHSKYNVCHCLKPSMSVMVEYQAILASIMMTLVDEHDACCPPRAAARGSESFDQADQLIARVL